MLNGKVNSYISGLIRSGALTGAEGAAIASASSSSSLSSLDDINALPSDIQDAVREAFRQGSRDAFISLIPWCALAFIGALFLSKIKDSDRQTYAQEARALHPRDMEELKTEDVAGTPTLKPEEPGSHVTEVPYNQTQV